MECSAPTRATVRQTRDLPPRVNRSYAIRRLVGRIPPFDRPTVRARTVRGVRQFRRARRDIVERFGSVRYSRPGLHDIDRQLEAFLPAHGVFVEAGANDGYRQSNTYFLERIKGWSGVLIEAIPVLAEDCRRQRSGSRVFNCALVEDETSSPIVSLRYADLVTSMAHPERSQDEPLLGWHQSYDVDVPGRTLSSVLDEAGVAHVDFLSLDIEGYEPQALRGLDFGRHAPSFMLIEVEGFDPDRLAAVEDTFGEAYERVARLSTRDALYRRR